MSREQFLMDFGWKFHRGEVDVEPIHPRMVGLVYLYTKSQRGRGAAAAEFNDTDWRTVNLPHDFVVEGTPSPEQYNSSGCLERGNAWYRRYFRVEESDRSKRLTIRFEGVCTHCTVWVNGHLMVRHFGGYEPFEIDITDVAAFGAVNVISVYVQCEEFEGWWYEGGGIYRHVWLEKTDRLCVETDGTYVVCTDKGDHWDMDIETVLRNTDFTSRQAELVTEVHDPRGNLVATHAEPVCVNARDSATIKTRMQVENPALWSLDERNLYTLVSRLVADGEELDCYKTTYGYRTIEFDPDQGFFLNGKNIKIKGVCVHEDFGGLGVGLSDNVKLHRVRKLQEIGCNGIRTSHNPHSSELLDICDREGMLVMDENRWFESWGEGERQLRSMIRRDRNHPCVIFWSLGNEEPIQAFESGKRVMQSMRQTIKSMDTTRPVLMAMHTGLLNGQATSVSDVIGINYNEPILEQIHKTYPNTPLVGSEMLSVSNDPEGDRALGIETWRLVRDFPFMMGYYIWTGIDYRGEHRFPTFVANAGAMDINCNPKDDTHIYRSFWTEKPFVHIWHSWNVADDPAATAEVRVFSNAETVELFLNGRPVGTRKVDIFDITPWTLPSEPGELKAVARIGDKVVAEHVLQTSGKPCKVHLTLENCEICGDGQDHALVNACVLDAEGRMVPDADVTVTFRCTEGGHVAATCSGDICDENPCPSHSRKLYLGLCQAAVRTDWGAKALTVTATAEGLESDTLTIALKEPAGFCPLAQTEPASLRGWEISPVREEPWDLDEVLAAPQTIAWQRRDIGACYTEDFFHLEGDAFFERLHRYAVFHLRTTLPDEEGAILFFEEVIGQMDVRILHDGICDCGKKDVEESGDCRVVLSSYTPGASVDIYIGFHSPNTMSGIVRPVRWAQN